MIARLFRKLTERKPPVRTLADVLDEARRAPARPILQPVTDAAPDESHVRALLRELIAIVDAGFEVQVRLTGLGLDFSIALVMECLTQLVERSEGRTVWVELESPDCHDVTHELVRRVRLRYTNVQLQKSGSLVLRYRAQVTD